MESIPLRRTSERQLQRAARTTTRTEPYAPAPAPPKRRVVRLSNAPSLSKLHTSATEARVISATTATTATTTPTATTATTPTAKARFPSHSPSGPRLGSRLNRPQRESVGSYPSSSHSCTHENSVDREQALQPSHGATPRELKIDHLLSVGHLQKGATDNKENEKPFQRKWAAGKQVSPIPRIDIAAEAIASPERKPLASRSRNTQQAAPPTKVSVPDAAVTTTGATGAANNNSSQTKQRRNILKVNNRIYTRFDCIGKGGTAKVWHVMTENGKMLALKRVSLENAPAAAIKGFLGEVSLLQKLNNVEHVIKLYDSEMNHDKKVLSLVMELGDQAFDKVLEAQQTAKAPKMDPVLVRYYWKQMVQCVQSVHEHNVVHSDLKPSNFVTVQGNLKLIDFGIADAIQADETLNLHRHGAVGTPNYMSPESLSGVNHHKPPMPGQPTFLKLGKPSDVWSLGCILYQMVYGRPPFSHIENQMARCHAIVDWRHAIKFPPQGTGGVTIPPSLMRTMKRCLIRDEHMRPTCEELLDMSDPFLYPQEHICSSCREKF